MDLELYNKPVIITGAASGIGASIYMALLEEKAIPIGIDVKLFKCSELESKLEDKKINSSNYSFFNSDVADHKSMKKILDKIPRIYSIVNNAGILSEYEKKNGVNNKSWDKVMGSHAKGAMNTIELSLSKFDGEGSILNIGSIESEMGGAIIYSSAKGALYSMTMAYANSLGPKGIRVNMLSPGNVLTENNINQFKDKSSKNILEKFDGKTPLRRSATPEEIAKLAVFLISPINSIMTGANIVADGGYSRALWDPSWIEK